jgi:protein SCO1/2
MTKGLLPGCQIIRGFCIFSIVLSLSPACRRHEPGPEQRYAIKGKVVNVDKRGSAVTVAHEAIPGYMDAMTMPFKLKDPSLLDMMADGDRLQATLVVTGLRSWLEDVVFVRESADSSGVPSGLEPRPGGDVPDFNLVNQYGKKISLRQYRGRALLLTFIYTRCPLPDYCPLMTERFGDIEKALAADAALYANTHLLSITVDPEYDTPQVLLRYAAKESTAHASGSRQVFAHWEFATGSKEQVKAVATYFGMQFWKDGDQIIHSLRTALIGPDGRFLKLYPGNEWTPQNILGDLHAIVGLNRRPNEQKPTDAKQTASTPTDQTEPNIYRGVGVVEEANKETATVQINHEDIKDFMPAMSMPFKVRSRSLLDLISVGDHVEFRVTGDLVIISIKKL